MKVHLQVSRLLGLGLQLRYSAEAATPLQRRGYTDLYTLCADQLDEESYVLVDDECGQK